MSNESFNQLISNFSTLIPFEYQVLLDISCVAIDSCNNRIGINTLDPSYSIHIVGKNETICVSNIIVTNLINVPLSDGSDLHSNQIYRDTSGFLKINI